MPTKRVDLAKLRREIDNIKMVMDDVLALCDEVEQLRLEAASIRKKSKYDSDLKFVPGYDQGGYWVKFRNTERFLGIVCKLKSGLWQAESMDGANLFGGYKTRTAAGEALVLHLRRDRHS